MANDLFNMSGLLGSFAHRRILIAALRSRFTNLFVSLVEPHHNKPLTSTILPSTPLFATRSNTESSFQYTLEVLNSQIKRIAIHHAECNNTDSKQNATKHFTRKLIDYYICRIRWIIIITSFCFEVFNVLDCVFVVYILPSTL